MNNHPENPQTLSPNQPLPEDFFNNIPVTDLSIKTINNFKGRDLPGFKLEAKVGGFTIKTFRVDWSNPDFHMYSTVVHGTSYPEESAQKTTKDFESALILHYSVYDYIEEKTNSRFK